MRRQNGCNRLYLQDNLVTYDDVGGESFANPCSLVGYRDASLAFECTTGLTKFVTETLFIDRFQQAWSGVSVDFERQSDNVYGS